MVLTVHVLPNQWFLSETRPVLLRDSEIAPCPGGETCCGLSILWLGSILETLDLALATPQTARPSTQKERGREQGLVVTL